MRKLLLVGLVMFGLVGFAVAQDPCQSKSNPGVFVIPPGKAPPSVTDSDRDALREALRAEEDFKTTGPRLFSMDDALLVSARTGKPVVCWMGKHIFANSKARQVSKELGDTTIQAVMDTDGETVDAKGRPLPTLRVKFSDGNYGKDARTAFIPVSKLDKDSGRKILEFTRGGN